MKLILENWKHYITESHSPSHIAMEIRDIAEGYPKKVKFAIKQNTDYNIIGIGQGRAVIKLDNDKVIKVAYNSNGIQQNNQEIVAWNKTKSDLLLPILESDDLGHYIVVPYAKICGEECEEQIEIKRGAVKKLLANVGVKSLIDIYNISNWGIHDGQVKVIDYGS